MIKNPKDKEILHKRIKSVTAASPKALIQTLISLIKTLERVIEMKALTHLTRER
jgi:hypothetical protein